MANKVKFNIHNFHYALKKDEGYETPVHVPGAVSIALEAQGELTPFYADGIKYYVASSNDGYQGDLELALIPDKFREEVLKEVVDTNKVLFENANANPAECAIGFDIDGNEKTTRFWFFNCTFTRPGTNAQTNEASKTPQTDTITVSAAPLSDGTVRAKTTAETTADVFDNWYKQVYAKTEAAAVAEE